MLRFRFAIVLAALCLPLFASAASEVRSPDGSTAGIVFDPVTMVTNVAATAPASGTYDLRLYSSITCEVTATSGAPRAVIPKCYADKAGSTLTFNYPTMTVDGSSAQAFGRYVMDPRTSAATGDAGVTDSPNVPCGFLKFTAAAAGPGTISCTARR